MQSHCWAASPPSTSPSQMDTRSPLNVLPPPTWSWCSSSARREAGGPVGGRLLVGIPPEAHTCGSPDSGLCCVQPGLRAHMWVTQQVGPFILRSHLKSGRGEVLGGEGEGRRGSPGINLIASLCPPPPATPGKWARPSQWVNRSGRGVNRGMWLFLNNCHRPDKMRLTDCVPVSHGMCPVPQCCLQPPVPGLSLPG